MAIVYHFFVMMPPESRYGILREMNTPTLLSKWIAGLLIAIFVGVLFHAPLTVWLEVQWPQYDIFFKSWKELLMGVVLILLSIEVIRKKAGSTLKKDTLFWIAVAYIVLHVIMLPFHFQGLIPAAAGLLIDVRYVLFFVLVYILLKMYPSYRRPFLIASASGAALSLLFAFLQITVLPYDILKYLGYSADTIRPYLTVDRSYEYIRINGTFRGPNPLGIFAGIVLAASAAVLVKQWSNLRTYLKIIAGILIVFSIAALWFSYSRSAAGAAGIAAAVVLVSTLGRRLPVWLWVSGAVLAGAGVGLLAVSWNTAFVQQVVLHNNPSGGSVTKSNDEHFESLAEGGELLLEQPFGAGIGSAGSASLYGDNGLIIENQYLFIAHEIGWLGLALFIVLFGVVLWRLWQRRNDWLALGVCASGIGIAAASILLPVWNDDSVSVLWWGLAAISLATTTSGILEQTGNTTNNGTIKQKTTSTTSAHR